MGVPLYGIDKKTKKFTLKKIRGVKNFLSRLKIKRNGEEVLAIDFVKNSFVNTNRYIAEIRHRVISAEEYAKDRDLQPVFFTLTLPTEYHYGKEITLKNGLKVLVKNKNYKSEINGEINTPKLASKHLSDSFKRILKHSVYSKIPSYNRLYFRVIEPHKDGTPHTHVLFFIPKDRVKRFVRALNSLYKDVQINIVTDVRSSTSYMMKYVLKTLDDLRQSEDNISSLTCWYVYWGICRIYTSRNFVSLDIYRKLYGRYDLLTLTKMYNDGRLKVYIDPVTKRVEEVQLSEVCNEVTGVVYENVPIYQRKKYEIEFERNRSYEPVPKKIYTKEELKEKNRLIPIVIQGSDKKMYYKGNEIIEPVVQNVKTPSRMTDLQLYLYYKSLDPDDYDVSYVHFAITQNEALKRGIIDDGEYIPLNEALIYDKVEIDDEIF